MTDLKVCLEEYLGQQEKINVSPEILERNRSIISDFIYFTGQEDYLLTAEKIRERRKTYMEPKKQLDPINHPPHYERFPDIDCIDVCEKFNLCLGSVIQYIWRAGVKDKTTEIEDLKKAAWYLNREIERLEKEKDSFKAQIGVQLTHE